MTLGAVTAEGQALGKIYRCLFMEASSLMSFQLETLLSSLLAQVTRLLSASDPASLGKRTSLPAPVRTGRLIGEEKRGLWSRLRRGSRRMVRSAENMLAKLVK